jgi:LysR family nitrogen assimilation transcriptional regulator
MHEWLQVGRIDIGLLYNPTPSPAIESRPLLEEALYFVGRRQRGRAPRTMPLRDLPRHPLIIPSRPHAIRMLVETRLAAFGLKPQVAMEIDAISAILELVAEGHGFAVLSPRALDGADVARRLVSRPIVRPRLASTLAIAISAQRPSTPLLQAAVVLIEDAARSTMAA